MYSSHREGQIMKTNLDTIREMMDYIEKHLEERLDLDSLCREAGYSRYHLSRCSPVISGFSVHTYIQRRRLTEAARLLVFTDKPVMEIALFAGYETQQSFTIGFKAMYKCSPRAFRRKKGILPLTAENDCGRIRKTERRQDDGYPNGGRRKDVACRLPEKYPLWFQCNRAVLEKNACREGKHS